VSLAIKAVTKLPSRPYKLIKMGKWVKDLVAHWNAKEDEFLTQAACSLKKEHIEGTIAQSQHSHRRPHPTHPGRGARVAHCPVCLCFHGVLVYLPTRMLPLRNPSPPTSELSSPEAL